MAQLAAGMFVSMVIFLILESALSLWSSLYGGSVAIIGSLLLAWGLHRAGLKAANDPGQGNMLLLLNLLQRFVLMIFLLGLGFGVLKLNPIPLLIGFASVQLVYGLMPWLRFH